MEISYGFISISENVNLVCDNLKTVYGGIGFSKGKSSFTATNLVEVSGGINLLDESIINFPNLETVFRGIMMPNKDYIEKIQLPKYNGELKLKYKSK